MTNSTVNSSISNESAEVLSDEPSSSNGFSADPPAPSSSSTSSGAPLKKRRKRTNLHMAQRTALDTYFDINPRPDHDRMAEIAEIVGLDRDVVRVWFCNRRQKLRKE
ncbi:unnamed protein product [Gongylonema pulchrum]|uniref:Homeobox domain-containing protein n=1 Tax=Gongylonema pulchrum TaxID=637853 RepID=A0A3P6SB62_9BILA|nr:unnamed protein product [Gongylonema pulchrum]